MTDTALKRYECKGQTSITDWLSAPGRMPEPLQEKQVIFNGKMGSRCAACNNWHFNTAAPASCPYCDCITPEYKDFVSAIDAHKNVVSSKRVAEGEENGKNK